MKLMNKLIITLVLFFPFVLSAQTNAAAKLQNKNDSLSYALGVDIGRNLGKSGVSLNQEAMARGLRDALAGSGTEFTAAQAQALVREFAMEVQKKQMQMQNERALVAKEEGANFLAENKSKQGVTETASGLQYKVLKAGTGQMPTTSNTVKVHYEGRLLNGTIFDSSYQRGQPIEFQLGGVIQGWIEGLQLMKEGAKYQLYIPYNLAYGERGSPPNIGPYETLIFDVELIEVK